MGAHFLTAAACLTTTYKDLLSRLLLFVILPLIICYLACFIDYLAPLIFVISLLLFFISPLVIRYLTSCYFLSCLLLFWIYGASGLGDLPEDQHKPTGEVDWWQKTNTGQGFRSVYSEIGASNNPDKHELNWSPLLRSAGKHQVNWGRSAFQGSGKTWGGHDM